MRSDSGGDIGGGELNAEENVNTISPSHGASVPIFWFELATRGSRWVSTSIKRLIRIHVVGDSPEFEDALTIIYPKKRISTPMKAC
jgi:hypothetical protein